MHPKSLIWLVATTLVAAFMPGNIAAPCQRCSCCELTTSEPSAMFPAFAGCIHCCSGGAAATEDCTASDRCSCESPVALVGTEPEQQLIPDTGEIVQKARTIAECRHRVVAVLDRISVHSRKCSWQAFACVWNE